MSSKLVEASVAKFRGYNTYLFSVFPAPFGPGFRFLNIRPVNCSSRMTNCSFPKGRPVRSCCRNFFASSSVAAAT